MNALRSTLVASLLVAAACGGSQPEATAPTPPAPSASAPPATEPPPATSAAPEASAAPATSAAPTPPPPPAPKSWKDLTHEERLAVMKEKVLPTMKEEFQKVDAKKYGEFTCVTCHGPGIKQGKFDMPNPGLPKLNVKNSMKDEEKKHPAMMKFMNEVVVPKMSEMLNVPKYDPATHVGFACGNCHTMIR